MVCPTLSLMALGLLQLLYVTLVLRSTPVEVQATGHEVNAVEEPPLVVSTRQRRRSFASNLAKFELPAQKPTPAIGTPERPRAAKSAESRARRAAQMAESVAAVTRSAGKENAWKQMREARRGKQKQKERQLDALTEALARHERGALAYEKRSMTQDEADYSSVSDHSHHGRKRYVGGTSCSGDAHVPERLRVYMYEEAEWTWGRRVNFAIREFAPPWVCWTDYRGDADVEIHHIDSRNDVARFFAATVAGSPPYVAIQHSFAFSDASTANLHHIWRGSLFTASFQQGIAELATDFTFWPMPWGADNRTFVPPTNLSAPREPHVTVVGDSTGLESHGSVLFAAAHAGLRMRHMGCGWRNAMCDVCRQCPGGILASFRTNVSDPPLNCQRLPDLGGNRSACSFYDFLGPVDDGEMVQELQRARFAAVMREFEGFEMPGIEALFCGARPVVFDISTYSWYAANAVVVRSGTTPFELFGQLTSAFRRGPDPVGAVELAQLHAKFSWQSLVPGFFEQVKRAVMARAKLPAADVAARGFADVHSARVKLALSAPAVVLPRRKPRGDATWRDPVVARIRAEHEMKALNEATKAVVPEGMSPFQRCMLYRPDSDHHACPGCRSCPKVGYADGRNTSKGWFDPS